MATQTQNQQSPATQTQNQQSPATQTQNQQSPEAEGLNKIGEGLNAMLAMYLAPSMKEMDVKHKEHMAFFDASKKEMENLRKSIKAEMEGALTEPKKLFQQCLQVLDSQEKKIEELSLNHQSFRDECKRDLDAQMQKLSSLVSHLKGIQI